MSQNIYDNLTFFNKYITLRKSGLTYNDFVEQPAIRSLLPDLLNKEVLDLGCGTGVFAKYCIDSGAAKVTGIDISKNMIEIANEENSHEGITYLCMPMEELQKVTNQYDLIVSSLAIHYVEDYLGLVNNISRLLKHGGEFLFSIEHPFVTARKEMDNWIEDELGNKLHYAIDNYQEEGKRELHWFIDGVTQYHRTFSTTINTLIEHGLTIEKVIEPEPTTEGLEKLPKLMNERRKPTFIIIKTRKQ